MFEKAGKNGLWPLTLLCLFFMLISRGLCSSILAGDPQQKKAEPQVLQAKPLAPDKVRELIEEKIRQIVSDKAQESPLSNPPEKQLGAPSSTNLGSTVVDRPSFSELLGLAFDNDLVALGDGVASFSLDIFAFLALANPAVLDQQSKYGKYDFWRRFGASVSLGGKGDSFDRDGDGKKDEALKAEKLSDIVTWEARYRLFGTRDRRDNKNFSKYLTALGLAHGEISKKAAEFLNKHEKDWLEKSPDGRSYYSEDKVDKTLSDPQVEKELMEIAKISKEMADKYEDVGKEIDKSPVVTIAASGTSRDYKKYGPSKLALGLRGVWGWGNWDNTFNFEWSKIESLQENPAGRAGHEIKLAYQASTLWLKNSAICEEGITVAAGMAAEFYSNIPDALHDSIIKASVQLVYPVAKSVSIPVSVTWANHRDLLSKEGFVRGNIGLSVDLSQFQKKKKSENSE